VRSTPPKPPPVVPVVPVAPPSAVEDQLLVVVIAGGSYGEQGPRSAVYPSYKSLWFTIADLVAPLGVHIYLVSMNPDVPTTISTDHQLIFKGQDSLVPGVLEESFLAMDYVFAKKLPGCNAPHILRTNLSSFWQFSKLLAWLKTKVGYFVAAKIGDGPFPSGAGTVLSRETCKMLLSENRTAWLASKEPDDVELGLILKAKKIPITPMNRFDLIHGPPDDPGNILKPDADLFHFRIKTNDPWLNVGIFTYLWADWYQLGKISDKRRDWKSS